jgi:hypothetical protein
MNCSGLAVNLIIIIKIGHIKTTNENILDDVAIRRLLGKSICVFIRK